MPRCCVPDCDSGSFKEVKRTKAAGLRLKSHFTFPKNEDLLKKWKEILFHTNDNNATDKLKVCEIHFCESDIIKYYETLLKDGTIHRIPRHKYSLKKEAIPISMRQHKRLPIKNNIQEKNNDNDMSQTISTQHQLTMTIGNQDNNESFEKSESLPIRACNDHSSTIVQETTANTCCLESQISNKFKCKEKEDTQIKVYKRNRQTHNVKLSKKQSNVLNSDKKLTVKKESENNNCIPSNEEDSDHFDEGTFEDHYGKQDNESAKHTQTVNIEMSSNKESCNKINDNCIKDYNFLQLKNDLQSKCLNISSSWAYALEENTSVTFAYVHPLKQTIQLICIIDYNMNVKMTTFNKRVVIDVSIKFNSRIEFETYFWKLEKTKCCDGTGVKNIFSDKCQGFISRDVEYKRSRGYNRCNRCREHRKWVLKKQRNRIDNHLHRREQTRKIQLLQYKYKQLQKVLSKK